MDHFFGALTSANTYLALSRPWPSCDRACSYVTVVRQLLSQADRTPRPGAALMVLPRLLRAYASKGLSPAPLAAIHSSARKSSRAYPGIWSDEAVLNPDVGLDIDGVAIFNIAVHRN